MPVISGEKSEGVQAVVLTLRILEHLGRARRPLGVTALATALDTNKSRIFRHLRTLVSEGYLVQCTETERYEVGARFVGLGRAVTDRLHLGEIATPHLHTLRDALGHFSVISEVEGGGVRILVAVSGTSPIEIGVKQGSLLSFHASAQGKIALAFGEEKIRRDALRSRLEMQTPKTIVSVTVLNRDLEKIKRQGWAVAPNEALLGLNALAAPVFDASGKLIASVAIVDSIQFIEAVPSPEQIAQTIAAAQRISAALGHNPN
jgi:IclR family transcriptional regulator, KDG regulon repressor